MTHTPLTPADHDRIAWHVALLRGFFNKMVLGTAVVFPIALLVFYYSDVLEQMEPRVRYTLIGILCLMPLIQYRVFSKVVSDLDRDMQRATKHTVTGTFAKHGRDAQSQPMVFITTADGQTRSVPARGAVTVLSGQRDPVVDTIKALQPGQTVTVDYLEQPNVVLRVA